MVNSGRTAYFDYLRVAASFAVVLLHVAGQNWSSTDINTFEWSVFNIYDGSVRWGVPVFVMISGALFLNKTLDLKVIFRKYILKMIVVFLFWSTLFALWDYYIIGSITTINSLIKRIIVGRLHLWFIPMIIGMYMIIPFLNRIIRDRDTTTYFLLLSFLFNYLFPETIEVIKLFSTGISGTLSTGLGKLDLNLPLGFSGYYVLGYVLNTCELSKRQLKGIYIAGIFGLFMTIALTAYASFRTQEHIHFYGNHTVNTLSVAVSVFLLAKQIWPKNPSSPKRQTILMRLSKNSFGVYLVHIFIIDILKIYGITTLSFNPIMSVPVISLFVFLISNLISSVLNKIPFLRRWLV